MRAMGACQCFLIAQGIIVRYRTLHHLGHEVPVPEQARVCLSAEQDVLGLIVQKVKTLSASLDSSYKSSIQPMGQVLDPSRPWDFMHTPQT
jgi:hypothetical protein